jgi:hypothetical protein
MLTIEVLALHAYPESQIIAEGSEHRAEPAWMILGIIGRRASRG